VSPTVAFWAGIIMVDGGALVLGGKPLEVAAWTVIVIGVLLFLSAILLAAKAEKAKS